MTASDRLRRLFEYDSWANDRVLGVLKEQADFEYTEKTITLMSHLMAAQELWYRRIKGLNITDFEVWPNYTIAKLNEMAVSFERRWLALIDEAETDLDRVISYKNTSGTAYETMLSDILHHVVIHGQHHRAQIATWMREGGIAPPATDFIFYTRK